MILLLNPINIGRADTDKNQAMVLMLLAADFWKSKSRKLDILKKFQSVIKLYQVFKKSHTK